MYWKNILKIKIALALCLSITASLYAGKSSDLQNEFNVAKKLYEEGNYSQSIDRLENLLDETPKSKLKRKAYRYLAESYQHLGKFEKALSIYQLAVEIYPKDVGFLTSLGKLYYDFNLLDRTKEMMENALQISPSAFEANEYMAYAYEHLGFLSEASSYYEKALKYSPEKTPNLWHNFSLCLYKQRKFQKSMEAIKISLDFEPENPEFLFTLARIEYALGESTSALSNIKKASVLMPERKDILLTFALWLIDEGNTSESLKMASLVLKKEPSEPLALWVSALAYIRKGKIPLALDYLNSAVKTKSPFISETSNRMIKELKN
ncbi:MAG TPA: tetratricopeptide repeat protein [Elusimicrobiales bacterium]|nr:tetratricopeptide repeat protein [Elusimicrobiales bacterium]